MHGYCIESVDRVLFTWGGGEASPPKHPASPPPPPPPQKKREREREGEGEREGGRGDQGM